jgi:hypothetical protein
MKKYEAPEIELRENLDVITTSGEFDFTDGEKTTTETIPLYSV